jgi:hypothetical protein
MPATPSLVTLPTLSDVVVSLGHARDTIAEAARLYDRATLADKLWVGVLLLAGQEHHAVPQKQNGKSKVLRRRTLTEISPDQVHPQGYLAWLKAAAPWLAQPTAYKYMDAARAAGLLPDTSEAETRSIVADLLARHDALTLGTLVAQGKALRPSKPDTRNTSTPSYQQLTFDALLGYRAQSEQLISCVTHMDPHQYRIACARAYDTLKRLTGQPWQPSDEDVPEYISILSDATAGGL